MPSPSRYVVPQKLAEITPRQFLRMEKSLPVPKPQRPFERYAKVSEENARRISEMLLREFKPCDQVGTYDVRRITGYSEPHSRAIVHRLKQLDAWPFLPPLETRGRKPKPKESPHAGSESQAARADHHQPG